MGCQFCQKRMETTVLHQRKWLIIQGYHLPLGTSTPNIFIFAEVLFLAHTPKLLLSSLDSSDVSLVFVARQRGSHKSSKIREPDREQIVFVFSVEGIVTLEWAFSATLDVIPRPLFRAR